MEAEKGLEELFENETVTDEKLETLGGLVAEMKAAELEVSKQEEILKEKKEELRKLSQDIIPATVLSSGFSELKLESGEKVIIKKEVKASIAKAKKLKAKEDMVRLEIESDPNCSEDLAKAIVDEMFKDTLVITKPSPEVEQMLIDQGVMFDKNSDIHWQTLRKYVTGLEDRGQQPPDSITVFKYNETKIK